MSEKAVAKIELTSYTTAEELKKILYAISNNSYWEVDRVPNPDKEEREPDFYLIRNEDDEE